MLAGLTACDSTPDIEYERSPWSEGAGAPTRTSAADHDGPVETLAPVAPVSAPSIILIRDFQVAHPTSNADSGGRPRLLPGFLRGMRSDLSQAQLVGRLSRQVADELERLGFHARRDTGGPLPRSGWLVQGTFVEYLRPDGNFISDRWGKQDVELTISIDDLVRGVPETLTDLTVDGTASGIGAPMMPNAYAAGAKFVVRQVELEGDAGTLANRIADAIARFAASEHVRPGPRR